MGDDNLIAGVIVLCIVAYIVMNKEDDEKPAAPIREEPSVDETEDDPPNRMGYGVQGGMGSQDSDPLDRVEQCPQAPSVLYNGASTPPPRPQGNDGQELMRWNMHCAEWKTAYDADDPNKNGGASNASSAYSARTVTWRDNYDDMTVKPFAEKMASFETSRNNQPNYMRNNRNNQPNYFTNNSDKSYVGSHDVYSDTTSRGYAKHGKDSDLIVTSEGMLNMSSEIESTLGLTSSKMELDCENIDQPFL
jgi:hypothetical protein